MVSKPITVNFNALYPIFMKVGLGNLIVSAVAFIVSAMAASVFAAVSVFIGTAIGIINLSIMARTVKNGFLFKPDKAHLFIMKRYYIRFFATIFVVGVLVSKNLANPVGLIIGFSIIMSATMASTIYFAKKELV
ncbi:MAG: ATP synthase subunit I [Deltaproteobacteria bacterium]|nr:ATP synthase subunit I [Deltaproteobacteria bacterium]